jgi:hypothetical protein
MTWLAAARRSAGCGEGAKRAHAPTWGIGCAAATGACDPCNS